MAAKSSSRGNTRITLIGIHTNEGPNAPGDEGRDRTAENLASYLDGVEASYHKIVDDDSTVNYVPDERYCWALRSGNPRSLNLCFTGYAKFTRDEWLRHDGMLRRGAAIVRAWCDRWGVPKVKLTSAQVGRDESGVCGHVNWTEGKNDGTHWDPGPGFPWDLFMTYVNAGTTTPDIPVTPATKGFPDMLDRELPEAGTYSGTIIDPTGGMPTSDIVKHAWFNARCAGGAVVSLKFKKSADSDGEAPDTGPAVVKVALKNAKRGNWYIPATTEWVEYEIDAKGPGAICVELKAV